MLLIFLVAWPTNVDIVLSRYDEDTSWVQRFRRQARLVIYNKGPPQNGTIELPNVGRESHTYLHHIVNNYDDLARWTVFSQAQIPAHGYIDTKGHLSRGVTFQDYLMEGQSSFWINTASVTVTGEWTFYHENRISYLEKTGSDPSDRLRCPRSFNDFEPTENMSGFNQFIRDKCTSMHLNVFWTEYLEEASNISTLYFPQGARFAISANQIRKRPVSFYRRLLGLLALDVDPCAGYYMEWTWPVIFGDPGCPGLQGHMRFVSPEYDRHILGPSL